MNLQLSDIVIILIVFSCFYFWWRNTAIRERALVSAKQECDKLNLQLLDGSVAGEAWRPTWSNGQLQIKRTFKFEFSSSGIARYQGKIVFLGHQQLEIWLSPHDF